MSGGHAHGLYLHGDGLLHRLKPQCKIAAALAFVLAVVATPRSAVWAFALFGALLAGVAIAAGVRLAWLARRLLVEVPFVVFALALPFVSSGERVEVAGLHLSVAGLWGAFNIVAKGTLGVAASVLVASTTEVADLLAGLERLRAPRSLTVIAGSMVRYADVIGGEMRRMRIARESRAYDPRWLWQARAIAASAGALFVRAYERGERVHLAMLSRGYAGVLPETASSPAGRAEWAGALSLPGVAAAIAVCALVTT